jgi:O-antigen/teichoic acid export membrane protein
MSSAAALSIFRRLTNSSLKRLFLNAGKLQLTRLLSAAISTVQIALVARYLLPNDYGIYALVLNTIYVIQSVLDVRCGELLIRFFFQYQTKGETDKAGAMLLLGGLVEASICILAALLLASFAGVFAIAILHSKDYTGLCLLAALMPLSNLGSGLAASIISIDRKYGSLALADAFSNILGFLILLPLLSAHLTVTTLLIVALLTQGLKAAFRWIFLLRGKSETKTLFFTSLRRFGCLKTLKPDAKAIRRFAFSNNLLAFLKLLQGSVPNFAIGILRTPADVAFYYLGQRICGRISMFCIPITDITYREVAEQRNKHDGRRSKAIKHGVFLVGLLVIPAAAVIVTLGHWVIPLVFGKNYAAGVLAMQITISSHCLATLFAPCVSFLLAEGKASLVNLGFAAGLVVQIVAIVLLVPSYASNGAALGLLGFSVISTGFVLAGTWKTLKPKPIESSSPSVAIAVH